MGSARRRGNKKRARCGAPGAVPARGRLSRWGGKGLRTGRGAEHLVKGVRRRLEKGSLLTVFEYPGRCENRVCSARESVQWRGGRCNACGLYLKTNGRERPAELVRVDGRRSAKLPWYAELVVAAELLSDDNSLEASGSNF